MTWKLWTYPNFDLLISGEGHEDWISSIKFHNNGTLLLTCSGDGTVRVWDIANSRCSHVFKEHAQPVWDIDINYSGDFMLSCSMDHSIKLWDLNVYKCRNSYRAHADSVNSVNFMPYSHGFCYRIRYITLSKNIL